VWAEVSQRDLDAAEKLRTLLADPARFNEHVVARVLRSGSAPALLATVAPPASSSCTTSSDRDVVLIPVDRFRRLGRPAHEDEDALFPRYQLDHFVCGGDSACSYSCSSFGSCCCDDDLGGGDVNEENMRGKDMRRKESSFPRGMTLVDIARLLGWNGLYT